MPSPIEPTASVLVTGASGGIGRAISQAFGQIGWYVGVHNYAHPEEAVKPTASCVPMAHAPKHTVQIKPI